MYDNILCKCFQTYTTVQSYPLSGSTERGSSPVSGTALPEDGGRSEGRAGAVEDEASPATSSSHGPPGNAQTQGRGWLTVKPFQTFPVVCVVIVCGQKTCLMNDNYLDHPLCARGRENLVEEFVNASFKSGSMCRFAYV